MLSELEVASSYVVPKLSIGKTRVQFRCFKKDEFYKVSDEQTEDLFEHRKSIGKMGDEKRVMFSKNDQKFNKSDTSKMSAKVLEV